MNQKIILFPQKNRVKNRVKNLIKKLKEPQMLFFVIIIAAIIGRIVWHFAIDGAVNNDIEIPKSQNVTYNKEMPIPMTTAQVANEFEKSDNKPILLYIYTTWCKNCSKNFPAINEVAREFQNTEMQFISLAIDRNLKAEELHEYLGRFGDVYFQPRYLAYKDGFLEFLQKRNINYSRHIPFTVLIARDGEVLAKFTGTKRKSYLRNKIVKELYGS